MSSVAPTLQAFFTDRLAHQRGASAHTVAAGSAAMPPPPPAAAPDVTVQLERPEGMLQRGTITKAEFDAQKAKLLGL